MNQFTLTGRLAGDPTIKDNFAGFTVASEWQSKDKEGVNYIPCVTFTTFIVDQLKNMAKGDQIAISGRLGVDDRGEYNRPQLIARELHYTEQSAKKSQYPEGAEEMGWTEDEDKSEPGQQNNQSQGGGEPGPGAPPWA